MRTKIHEFTEALARLWAASARFRACPGLHTKLSAIQPESYENILYAYALNLLASRFPNLIDLATYPFERSNRDQRVRPSATCVHHAA